jgi:hypothetical protein
VVIQEVPGLFLQHLLAVQDADFLSFKVDFFLQSSSCVDLACVLVGSPEEAFLFTFVCNSTGGILPATYHFA